MQRRRMRTLGCSAIIAAFVFAVAACGSSGKGSGSAGSGENTFGLSEFVITAPTNTLHAGRISVTAHNVGGEEHELVIVRADDVGSLPTKSDGSVDEDKIAGSDEVGEIEHVAPQSEKRETFDLKAGDYVAFCNLVDSMMGSSPSTMHGDTAPMDSSGMHGATGGGHVHFAEGMSVRFSVN